MNGLILVALAAAAYALYRSGAFAGKGNPAGAIQAGPSQTAIQTAPQVTGGGSGDGMTSNVQPQAVPGVPLVAPLAQITPAQVDAALAAQNGTAQAGQAAQAAVAQQEGNDYLIAMANLGVTPQMYNTFVSTYQNKRNPATGGYYTYDDIVAEQGWTVAQINAMSGFMRTTHLYQMSS